MAHCPIDKLQDLGELFGEIRSWPEVREPTPGTFYLQRVPFMHFHLDRTGRRWADIRDGADWGAEVDLPLPAPAAAQRRFLREARRRYATTASLSRPSSGRRSR
jgi:hypothetical protein